MIAAIYALLFFRRGHVARPVGRMVRSAIPSSFRAMSSGSPLSAIFAFTDERGEWRVVGHPYTTAGGKNADIRAVLVAQPTVTEVHLWGAHERVAVKAELANETF